jgi:hypothetical protein
VTVTGCTLLDNVAFYSAGAIWNFFGAVAVSESTLSGNTTASTQKTKTWTVAGLIIIAIQGVLVASAQADVPHGSYTQTCRSVYEEQNTLYATCKTVSGNWQSTSLKGFNQCIGGISNENGNLRCNFGSIPEGSYKQTCKRIAIQGSNLVATCQKMNGEWMNTRLGNYRNCNNGSVDNLDGLLTCDYK